MRVPNPCDRRSKPLPPGYSFSSTARMTSGTSSFNFSQNQNQSSSRPVEFSAVYKPPRQMPNLVPMKGACQNGSIPNGSRVNANAQPLGRRSVFDFARKNRVSFHLVLLIAIASNSFPAGFQRLARSKAATLSPRA